MILDDLVPILQAAGVGVEGTDLFKGQLPPDTVEAACLMEYPGGPGIHTMTTGAGAGARMEQPRVQLIVRSLSYQTGRNKVELAYKATDGLKDLTLGGVAYHRIEAVQAPFFLERDDLGRFKFVLNLAVMKALST